MLGLPFGSVMIAYLVCIGSTLLCVVYGIINWNRDSDKQEGGKK
jgi:hypothetical protein